MINSVQVASFSTAYANKMLLIRNGFGDASANHLLSVGCKSRSPNDLFIDSTEFYLSNIYLRLRIIATMYQNSQNAIGMPLSALYALILPDQDET